MWNSKETRHKAAVEAAKPFASGDLDERVQQA